MRYKNTSRPLGPKGRFFFGRVFPLFFLVPGALILYFGLQSFERAKASADWPSVTGLVISAEIDRKRGEDGTTYSAEIYYEYAVDGVTYSSNRVGYGDYGSSNPSGARKVVNEYPAGNRVKVYYMPEDHAVSVLEAGVRQRTYFLPIFGALFFALGLAMFLFFPALLSRQAVREVEASSEGPSHAN